MTTSIQRLDCKIMMREKLPQCVTKVLIALPDEATVHFFAGQYLALHLPDREQPAYYSIASAPGERELELHIQAFPEWDSAIEVMDYLNQNDVVSLSLAMGYARLESAPTQAISLLAAGTGFAQMKSIVEFLLPEESCPPIDLYWTARTDQDLYYEPLARHWDDSVENINFYPVISGDSDLDSDLHHRLLGEAVLKYSSDMANRLVFVSGSNQLVQTIYAKLSEHGMKRSAFYSDALEWITLPDSS